MTSTNHQENAVLLQQSASQLVAEQQDGRQLVAAAPLTPCSLAGLGPAISGAALGLLFGSGWYDVMMISINNALSTPSSNSLVNPVTTGSAMFGHLWGFVSRKPLSTPLLSTAWQSGVASAKVCRTMHTVHTRCTRYTHSTIHPSQTFAIMSGVYSTAVCFVTRIRQKQDGTIWATTHPLMHTHP